MCRTSLGGGVVNWKMYEKKVQNQLSWGVNTCKHFVGGNGELNRETVVMC